MRGTISFFAMLAGLLVACGYQSSDRPIIPSGPGAVYICAREGEKMGSGEFGDLWYYSFQTKHEYRLTDDSFFDTGCVLSPNGRRVAFLSNRRGSGTSRAIRGVGSPHELYIYDLDSHRIARVDEGAERRFGEVVPVYGSFNWLQWHPDGVSLLFGSVGPTVYRIFPDLDSVCHFVTIPIPGDSLSRLPKSDTTRGEWFLGDFAISPDGERVAFRLQHGWLPPINRFGVVDIQSGAQFLADSLIFAQASLGSWSEDGSRFLVWHGDALAAYAGDLSPLEAVLQDNDTVDIGSDKAWYMGERIVFLGALGANVAVPASGHIETNLLVLDTKNGFVKQLTSDEKYREWLSLGGIRQ